MIYLSILCVFLLLTSIYFYVAHKKACRYAEGKQYEIVRLIELSRSEHQKGLKTERKLNDVYGIVESFKHASYRMNRCAEDFLKIHRPEV